MSVRNKIQGCTQSYIRGPPQTVSELHSSGVSYLGVSYLLLHRSLNETTTTIKLILLIFRVFPTSCNFIRGSPGNRRMFNGCVRGLSTKDRLRYCGVSVPNLHKQYASNYSIVFPLSTIFVRGLVLYPPFATAPKQRGRSSHGGKEQTGCN